MRNEIFRTSDYSVFKKLKGNRGVEENRVSGLMKSIRKIGYISNPIIVNRKMEVIDGQGRLEALKRLAMPVEYIIVDDSGMEVSCLESCRVMNSYNKSWKPMDYINSYADSNVKDYVRMREVLEYFKVSPETVIYAMGLTSSGAVTGKIRDGSFKFTEADYIRVTAALNIRKKYLPAFDKFGGRRSTRDKVIFYLITYAQTHADVDHDKIIEALEACDPRDIYAQNFERLLESVQNVYNFNKRKKGNRLYFYEEYRLDNRL